MQRKCLAWSVATTLSAVSFVVPSFLQAQTVATGAITGTVRDPSGAAIPAVRITATERTTGATRMAETDPSGSYRISLLPPGEHYLRFAAQGFKTLLPPAVNVVVTEIATLDVQMVLGEKQEIVEVRSTVQLVQSQSATLGTMVDDRTITELPLSTRNYTQALTMSPGVIADVNNAAELGKGTQDVYVNGASNISNNFQMDGTDVNNFGSGRADNFLQQGGVPIPNPDAIEEFKVQTTLFDAGYGRGAGANVDVVTKSGSNELHGSAFEFFRNDVLDANDFFLNENHQPRPTMKQNQFGGSLGGRFIKDRAFFFGSYQGTRQINGLSPSSLSSNFLPPLTNDRSARALGQEFCGQSGTFGGVAVACDGSNINPVALKLLNLTIPDGAFLIPTPQVVAAGVGFSAYTLPGRFDENQFLINTDVVLSNTARLSERYFYSRAPQVSPFSPCLFVACTPGSAQDATFRNHLASLKLTSALSAHFVNEALVSFYRSTGVLTSESKFQDQDLGITPGEPAFPKMPVISVNGLFTIGGNFNDDSDSTVNQFQYADQIAWTRDRHTLRAGFQVERVQFDFNDPGPRRGLLLFLSFPDFLLGRSAAQNGTSVSNVFLTWGIAGLESKAYRATNYASFFQDDLKLGPRLTLNLGLRWEINGGVSDDQGRISSVWPSLALATNSEVAAGTLAGWVVPSNFPLPIPSGVTRLSGRTLARTDTPLHNLGPRFGFAWRPLARSDQLVLRGGYGIFYTRTNGTSTLQTGLSPPFVSSNILSGTSNALATLEVPFNPAPRAGAFPLRTPTSQLTTYYVAEDHDSPMVQQFSLDAQYEFLRKTLIELAYVGARGTRLASTRNTNEPLLASPSNPVNGITVNTVANAFQRVPIPGFAPGGLHSIETYGFSMYHSLQVTVRKQFSRGLQFQGAYTYGRVLTDVEGAGFDAVFLGGDGNSNSTADRHQRWGPADFDRAQRFVLTYLWEIPTPQGKTFVNRKLLNGWAFSGVTIFQSGLALTITDPLGGSIYGFAGTSRGQLCPGFTVSQISTRGGIEDRLNNYFNTAAVDTSNPACPFPKIGDGTGYGNLGRGAFRGPHQANFDVALTKTARVGGLHEGASLQFRTEFFDAFNHPQFGNPDTIVGSPSFGKIGSTSVAPRLIQFGLKYIF